MTATLDHRDTIAVLTLGSDENRFSPDWLESVDQHLTAVEMESQALITIGDGKFYSNGLDLEWLMAHGDRAEWYVEQVQALFARLLTFPLPTIAAINGHTFGAGAMLATAHDYRIMRNDRGYFCFPEIDINIPFTPGMAALIQAKFPPQTAVTAMTTGHRYGAAEALADHLIDGTAESDALLDAAVSRVSPLAGKNPGTLSAIKNTMYHTVVHALRQGRN